MTPAPSTLRYGAAAAALGAGWFPVLLAPSVTRDFLLASPARSLACLVAASVVTALAFRGYIARARSRWDHLVRGTVLPFAGCVAYLTLWAAWMWARSLFAGGLASLHDTLSLYAMGLTGTLVSCWITIPYGLLCQVVMHTLARRDAA